jgi:DNA primase large subunit
LNRITLIDLICEGATLLLRETVLTHLDSYDTAPKFDVTLEQFESWALDRLRVLAEIESSFVRNRNHEELKNLVIAQQKKYLSLNSNTAASVDKDLERKKDHVSHFVLRLAFCRSEDLRKRFIKAEKTLFRIRYETDDPVERAEFMQSRDFGWIEVRIYDPKTPVSFKSLYYF